jgi:hypothetical protein
MQKKKTVYILTNTQRRYKHVKKISHIFERNESSLEPTFLGWKERKVKSPDIKRCLKEADFQLRQLCCVQ